MYQDHAIRYDTILPAVGSRSTHPSNRYIPTELEYAFHLFSMIGEVLLKVKAEEVDIILITRSWLGQPWYSEVLELSVTEPVTSGLESVRQSLAPERTSARDAELIACARSLGISFNFESTWPKWVSWSGEQNINPHSCHLKSSNGMNGD